MQFAAQLLSLFHISSAHPIVYSSSFLLPIYLRFSDIRITRGANLIMFFFPVSSSLYSNNNDTGPFSRVDELLEAAASPSSHSPATSSSIQSNKPSKVKKSSSSRDIHTVSSSIKDTRDSSLYNSTSSASGSTNNSATPANSTNQGDITAKPAVVSAPRKSAYQGPKISMACYSCRSSKTRCSGTQPCNRCELKRMECSYPLRDGRTANRNS